MENKNGQKSAKNPLFLPGAQKDMFKGVRKPNKRVQTRKFNLPFKHKPLRHKLPIPFVRGTQYFSESEEVGRTLSCIK